MSPDANELQAIRAVIQRQLNAFLRDDAQTAFECETQAARNRAVDPKRFLDRVRRRYPALYRVERIAFDDVLDYQGRVAQQALIQPKDGGPALAIFVMSQGPEGWRIDSRMLYDLSAPTDDEGDPLVS